MLQGRYCADTERPQYRDTGQVVSLEKQHACCNVSDLPVLRSSRSGIVAHVASSGIACGPREAHNTQIHHLCLEGKVNAQACKPFRVGITFKNTNVSWMGVVGQLIPHCFRVGAPTAPGWAPPSGLHICMHVHGALAALGWALPPLQGGYFHRGYTCACTGRPRMVICCRVGTPTAPG